MPEGDALHRAARRLQALVGDEVEVETPHPRAAVKQLAPVLDGRRLERVEAIGKNLLLHFEDGVVLRSHLRMKGRWRVLPRDAEVFGLPWLVLRGERYQGVLFGGPVLELDRGVVRRLGPDILAEPPDLAGVLEREAEAVLDELAGLTAPEGELVARVLWAGSAPDPRLDNAIQLAAAMAPFDARAGARPDARAAERGTSGAPGLPARRPRVPALRNADPFVAAGRRRANGLLVSRMPAVGARARAASLTPAGHVRRAPVAFRPPRGSDPEGGRKSTGVDASARNRHKGGFGAAA